MVEIYKVVAIICSMIILFSLILIGVLKRVERVILENVFPKHLIELDGKVIKCDYCENNAIRIFNNKKRCSYHYAISKQNSKK